MPKGVKPPEAFTGKKGRSGRKSKAQEFLRFKEDVKTEALVELANSIVYAHLKKGRSLHWIAKEMGLPIVLKGMAEKVNLAGKNGEAIEFKITSDERGRIAKTISGIIKSNGRPKE